ncbi:sterol desaturase family protein [Undibacterium sp. Di27W]|uniref:sterol desaturase family protein n=1 Tax=Undibacterium sp. Di27W TaxID=3413036 RepID=UPI003BF00C19
MKQLFSYWYAPVFFFSFIGLATWMLPAFSLSSFYLIPLLLLAIAISFVAELYLPYEQQWNLAQNDRKRDTLHGLVNELFNMLGLALIPSLNGLIPVMNLWPGNWSQALQLVLAIVIADCGITLAHFFSHKIDLLWRFHAVHHSCLRMYGFNGLMKHPLHQAIEALAGILPLLLIGMPLQITVLLTFAIAIQLLLQHSNVDIKMGMFRHVFAWAPLHRFHHMKYGEAGNVNFALFSPVWDQILGTAFYPDYRLTSSDLGIGSQPDYPVAYSQQLKEPFRRKQVKKDAVLSPQFIPQPRHDG